MSHYVLGEMFSGPGGIALGAELASRSVASARHGSAIAHGWAVEYHPDTAETYRANIPGADENTVFTADVKDFDLRCVPEFDAFAFGFPCNDFSAIGERRGLAGDFGALYTYGVHALALHAPTWFVAENVQGLSRSDQGLAFGKILSSLRSPGRAVLTDPGFTNRYGRSGARPDLEYDLVAHLYRFEEYGLPQKRHRILITGIRKDARVDLRGGFSVPAPTTRDRATQMTAREALEIDPISPDAYNNTTFKHSQRVIDRLSAIEPGRGAFNTDFPNKELELKVTGATLSNIYRRLDPDAPSYTVTGSGGGGTHMYHWAEPRALTNRERARLQTFPDWFEFHGSRPSVRRQVGMAVPPEGAQVVMRAMLDTLDGIEYPSVQPNVDVDALIAAHAHSTKSTQVLRVPMRGSDPEDLSVLDTRPQRGDLARLIAEVHPEGRATVDPPARTG